MADYSKIPFVEVVKKEHNMLNDFGRCGDYCTGVDCCECPLNRNNNGLNVICASLRNNYPLEYVKIIMDYDPKANWLKIPVDTKILVRNDELGGWHRAYFAKYEDGHVYSFNYGADSFTGDKNKLTCWQYAKLYKAE